MEILAESKIATTSSIANKGWAIELLVQQIKQGGFPKKSRPSFWQSGVDHSSFGESMK